MWEGQEDTRARASEDRQSSVKKFANRKVLIAEQAVGLDNINEVCASELSLVEVNVISSRGQKRFEFSQVQGAQGDSLGAKDSATILSASVSDACAWRIWGRLGAF